RTQIRIGNPEYARDNGSYGLTTLLGRHVRGSATRLRVRLPGESGKLRGVEISGPRLARIARRCQRMPRQGPFHGFDESGKVRSVGSGDVNVYLREISGADFTAKDFRTWAGSVLTTAALQRLASPRTRSEARRNVVRAVCDVAEQLGNTSAVCRSSYVHPRILESYLEDPTFVVARGGGGAAKAASGNGALPPLAGADLGYMEILTLKVIARGVRRRRRPRGRRTISSHSP